MSHYDPRTQRIYLPPRASIYATAHEFAHADQHAHQTLAWRTLERTREIRLLGRFALMAVELEAAGMALRELHECGILQREDVSEAARGLFSYAASFFSGH